MNRREFLLTSSAAVAAASLPLLPPAAAPVTPAPVLPAWAVGPPDGEFNWISAVGTEHDAKLEWLNSWLGNTECDGGGPPTDECECEICYNYASLDVMRQPGWDGKATVSRGDWLRGGLGSLCSRCDNETFSEVGGHAIGDEAVCEDCMTLADWEKVDPERAAEMRADLADET